MYRMNGPILTLIWSIEGNLTGKQRGTSKVMDDS